MINEALRPVEWVGSSKEDLKRFPGPVQGSGYVLHAFQKKAKRGAETPNPDVELIKRRLKAAEQHYRDTYDQE